MTTILSSNARPAILTRSIAALATTAIAALLGSSHANAQSWSGTTSGAWLTTTNWTGGVAAGSSTDTADTDIAVFNVAAQTTVGINMNTTLGVYYLGAIDYTNATARTINNSSTTAAGILTLNGATVNAIANTILRNSTTTALTITNGTGTGTMGLALGNATNNIVQITSTGGITINSIISGVGSPLTLQGGGGGTLSLSGVNTYTGVTTILSSVLSINSFTNGGVAGSLGMASNASANLVLTGGTLSYAGGSTTTDRGMTFGGAAGNRAITVSNAASNLNLTNTIVGTGGQQIDFTKVGTGTLTLSNDNNSYIGRTFVSGGTLAVTSISAVGGGNSSIGVATSAANGLISIGFGVTTTTLSYIGTGNTTDRNLNLPGLSGGAVIEQSGTGLLKFTGSVGATGLGSKTLTLGGSTLGTGEIVGGIVDNGTTGTTAAAATITASTALVLGSVNGLTVGNAISGTGITAGTTISAINPTTRTVTLSAAATVAANAVITSAGVVNITSLAKTGTGTWTLSGASTYTGATTVSGGTLDLGGGTANGALSSPTLALAGGTLSYTRSGNTTQSFTTTNISAPSQVSVVSGNTLNLGTVVRGAGGALDFSTTGAGTVAALTASNVNGIMPGFTFGNTWAVANGAGVAISGLVSYTLTSVAGTTGANYLNGNIDVDNSAGLIDAAIAGNSLRFNSSAANTLTLAAGSNVLSGGGILVNSAVGSNLSTITGGTLTGSANQNLAIIQNNTSGGLTISSSIVDNTSTSVTKSGAGLLTIDAANTYTGGTTINAGTLQLSGAGTLGPVAARVAVSSGAVLDLNGTNQSITLAAGNGVGTVANNSGSGTSFLTLTATVVTDAGLLTIADSTSTPGGKVAVVVANNMQIPSNLNSYSGGTTVNAGAFFYLNFSSPLGAGTGPITLPAGTGATATSSGLLVDGGATYANDITGAGYVHNNSNGVGTAVLTGTLNTSGTFNFRNAAASFNFAGSGNSTLTGIIGPVGAANAFGPNATVAGGSIIKSGTGTLTLSGANAYTGSTTINGGILRVNGGGAIPNAGLVTLADASGVNFQVIGSETIGALAGGGATGGAVSIDAGQTLTLSSGTQTYSGTISGDGTLTVSGANQTLNGALSHTGGVNVTGGTLTLGSSSNTYTGATVIGSARGIIVTANNGLGATGTGNETTITGTGGGLVSGVLGLSGGITYSAAEKVIGSGVGNTAALTGFTAAQRGFIQSVSGNNTFAGDIELSGNGLSRIGTQDGASLTLTGAITQGAGITTANILFRAGGLAGDFVTLSNAGNSFGGDSQVFTALATPGSYAGVRLGINNGLPTNLTISGFGTTGTSTALDLAGFNQSLNGLITGGSPMSIVNLNTGTPSTLTLNPTVDKTSGNTPILGGGVLGVIDVVKDGALTQTLTSVNTYTGTTTINAGTLLVGVGGSISGSTTTVNATGTLGGSGTTGPIILAGGTLAPGLSPGILSSGNATFSGGTAAFEITGTTVGTQYDQLSVTGTVGFTANTALTISLGIFDPADNDAFILISNNDTDAVSLGGFGFTYLGSPLTEGASFIVGAQAFTISYAAGSDSNDVVLTAVPEPGSALMLIGGLATLLGLRRRRQ